MAEWPPTFRTLLVACFTWALGFAAFERFLSPFLREAGIPVVSIGYFHALSGVTGALASAVGGLFADRLGRRAVLFGGRALRVLGWVLILLFPRARWLVPIACVWGFGMAASGAFIPIIAESSPRGQRALGFAVTGVVEALGSMVVPVTIGAIADRLGLQAALALAVAPGLVTLYVITRLEETMAGARTANGREPAGDAPAEKVAVSAGLRFLLSPAGRGAAVMAMIWMVTGFESGFMAPVWALYVTDRFGVTYAGLGIVATASSVGAILGQLTGGRTADRVGYSKLMMVCLVSTSVTYALIPVASTPSTFALMWILTSFTGYLAAPCWGAIGSSAMPRAIRGAIAGLYQSLSSAGFAAGGVISGYVYLRGITLPFYLFALCELAMLCLVAAGLRAGLAGFSGAALHED